jgi:hypothetical protein
MVWRNVNESYGKSIAVSNMLVVLGDRTPINENIADTTIENTVSSAIFYFSRTLHLQGHWGCNVELTLVFPPTSCRPQPDALFEIELKAP